MTAAVSARRRVARGILGGPLLLVGFTAAVGFVGAAPASATTETWTQSAELTGSPAGSYGTAVATAAGTAVVGNPHDGNGVVFVYSDSGGTWSQSAALTPVVDVAGGDFGASVSLSISGTTAVVGAPDADGSGPGHVYVFTEASGAWTQTAELTDPGAAHSDEFGAAVAADKDGTGAVVGAPGASGANDNGAAYWYTSSGSAWSLQTTLTAPDAIHMGSSVAIWGNDVVVGDPGHAAYFFRHVNGTSWQQLTEFPVSAGDLSVPVAVYDDTCYATCPSTALVGDPQANSGQGAVYVLGSTTGGWTQSQELTATGPGFGSSVALQGFRALVGAQGSSPGGTAYVYDYDGTSWSEENQLTASDAASGDSFGSAVAMDPDTSTVIVGAPQRTPAAAYIFSEPGITVPCTGGVGDATALVNDLQPGNGVFDLMQGCTYTLTAALAENTFGLPTVSGSMVINGHGATITRSSASGTPQFGFLWESGFVPSLVLNDLTLSNGNAATGTFDSGGVQADDGTLSLNHVNLIDDIGDQSAGSLESSGATVSMQGSTVSGGGDVFNQATIFDGGHATISGSTFSDNLGSAIVTTGGASMVVTTSTFSGNFSGSGGIEDDSVGPLTVTGDTFYDNNFGIKIEFGSATVTDSTFTGNITGVGGGGAIADFNGALTLRNSTITDNVAAGSQVPPSGYGGGLFVQSGATAKVSGTLISGNTLQVSGQPTQNQDCTFFGTVTDEGYNLDGPGGLGCSFSAPTDVTGDPKVLPLAANGGPTETVAVAPGSAALDQIPPGAVDGNSVALCPDASGTDQRGLTRPQGPGCDIGAFEQAAVDVGVVPNEVTSPGSPVSLTATVTPVSVQPNGTPAPEGTVAFYDNGQLLGTAPLDGSDPDTATLSGQTLPSGPNAIQVGYDGDPAGLYGLVAGPASPSASTLTASPLEVGSGGTSTATVTLKDGQGNAIAGDVVAVTATGHAVVVPGSRTSDASGMATFSITDPDTELVTLSATDLTASVNLTEQVTVDFASGATIATVAGGGSSTPAPDGTPATAAGFQYPWTAVRDPAGNVVIADALDGLVQVVSESDGTFYGQDMTAGDIYTIAGGGSGPSGSTGTGVALGTPLGVAVDTSGDVVIGDNGTGDVWFLDEHPGTTTLFGQPMTAGDIYSIATLSGPAAVAVDAAGNVIVADSSSNLVDLVSVSTGSTSVIAGGGPGPLGDGGPATDATLNGPSGIAVDSAGDVIIGDTNDHAVRIVDVQPGTTDLYGVSMTQGDIYTVAGDPNATTLGDGGPATQAEFTPAGVAVDSEGNLLIADAAAIRAVANSDNTTYGIAMAAGDIYTVAGDPNASSLGDGGPALGAMLSPEGVSVYSPGVLLVADTFDGLVREVGPIITAPLPVGAVGSPYTASPTVAATSGPVTWSLSSGSLPPGLTIDPSTGEISGTPTTPGAFPFTLSATDSSSPPQTAMSGPLAIVVTGSGPASAPDLGAPTPGNASVTLSWSAVTGATGYIVNYSTTAGAEFVSGTVGCTTASLGCTVSGLANGTTYYFEVEATNAGGNSAPSNEVSSVPVAPPATAPVLGTPAPGNASVTLSWSAVTGATGYIVKYSTTTGAEFVSGTTGCTTVALGCTVTGLTNGTTYYFEVEATNAGGNSAPSNEVSAAPVAPPATAPVLGAPTPTSASVTLSWSAVTGATGYIVNYSTTAGDEFVSGTTGCTTAALGCNVTGLTNGTTYDFEVEATNAGGNSAPSNEVSSAPVAPPASAPVLGAPTPANASVTLSWSAVTGATGYIVKYSTTAGDEFVSGTAGCTTASLGCTVSGLANGTTYYFEVEATNAGGNSAPSNEVSAAPVAPPATAPVLGAPTPGNASVTLSWSAVTGATGYVVKYSTTAGAEFVSGTTGCTTVALGCTVTGLTNGTTYDFEVEATNAGGNSAPSNEVGSAPVAPPATAPVLGAPTPTNGSVTLSWSAVSGATGYIVKYSTTTGAEFVSGTAGCTTASLGCTVTGLTNGTTYDFEVEATNAGGDSAPSNEVSAAPVAPPASAPVLGTPAPGNASVTLSWSAVTGATGYVVNYSTTSGAEFVSGTTGCTTATLGCTVTGLTNGTTYFFEVEATNAGGNSAPSNEVGSAPVAPPATAPVLGAPTPTNGSVTLSWSAVSGATGYIVNYSTTAGAEFVSGTTGCTTASLGCTVTGLTNGTTYFFEVEATNAGGNSAPSNEVSSAPVAPPASAPVLGAPAPGNSSVTLSWSAVTGATGYVVNYSTTSGAEFVSGTTGCTTATLGCTVTGLPNGTTYDFEVEATNAGGNSLPSNEVSAAQVAPPASAPVLGAPTPGNASVTLSWSAVTGATGYIVNYSTTAGAEFASGTAGCTTASLGCTVSGLANGTTYFFEVEATNAGGNSAPSNEVSSAPVAPPATAPVLGAPTPGNASVTLSWSAVTGATGYVIKYSTTAGAEFVSGTTGCTTAGLGCTVSGLANGTTYFFEVEATNAGGNSAPSNEVSSAPVAPGGSTSPQGFGYWKNHQSQTTALLPLALGGWTVTSWTQAMAVFNATNCSGSTANNAVGCLAGQLLAAELNVANNAPDVTCVASAIQQANTFLRSVSYIGPSGTYQLSATQRKTATSLATSLSNYDNGSLTC